jgi:DNA replication and repair protein RecF
MKVTRFHFENFRNLKENTLIPCEGINVFYGDNAQGKTNLLEAIWLCSGAKSFRGAGNGDLITFGEHFANLTMDFVSQNREQTLSFRLGEKKRVVLNGVEKKSTSDLIETVFAVVFAPNHLRLVKDGPQERRTFMDFALCRLKPSFSHLQEQYQRALTQRNALLHNYGQHSFQMDTMLELWEEALANLGSIYARQRQKYVEKILPIAEKFYFELSGEKETLSLQYDGENCSADCGGYEFLIEAL